MYEGCIIILDHMYNLISFAFTGLELAAYQDMKEDASCLPTLKVSDIRKEDRRVPFDYIESGK